MVNYWKSKEGLKEYEKLGKPYENTVWDTDYEQFVNKTRGSDTEGKTKRQVVRITRLQAADGGEYIVYDEKETRYDGLGNASKRFRDNLGTYPIPQGQREIYYDENNNQATRLVSITNIETGYSIPFNKAKLDELHKNAVDNVPQRAGRTQYFVQRINDPPTTVQTYQDLKEGDFEELMKYGKKSFGWKEEKEHLKQEREQLMVAEEVSENPENPEDVRLKAELLEEQIRAGSIERENASPLKESGAADSVEILEAEEREDRETGEQIRKESNNTGRNKKK